MEFWIIFTVAATSAGRLSSSSRPSISPAATTAPVASIVPPSHAPPTIGSMPACRMKGGMATIIATVKASDRPMASDSSSFFALQAAPVAIAADTPHTDMSAEITMHSDFDGIFITRTPNQYVATSTIGVTTQLVSNPGRPSSSSRLKSTSAPKTTRPALMRNSPCSAGSSHFGTPTVLPMTSPTSRAHRGYSRL